MEIKIEPRIKLNYTIYMYSTINNYMCNKQFIEQKFVLTQLSILFHYSCAELHESRFQSSFFFFIEVTNCLIFLKFPLIGQGKLHWSGWSTHNLVISLFAVLRKLQHTSFFKAKQTVHRWI